MNPQKIFVLISTFILAVFVMYIPSASSMINGSIKVYKQAVEDSSITDREPPKADLLQYVNTLQGSHNTEEFSYGRTSPVVGLPHAVNYWSPGGYPYNDGEIPDFGGAGFSFMPQAGTLEASDLSAAFSNSNVTGKPHYYSVTLDNGITTEITATQRCGYFKLSYPDAQQAYVVIKGEASNMTIDPTQRTIANDERNYFVQFDQPFVSYGKINGESGADGVYIEFKEGANVQFKVSPSSISLQQAKTTFDREIAPHSFNEVKEAAGETWNKLFNKIVVEGSTLEQRKTFYSSLYRTNLRPAKDYEVDEEGTPRFYHDGKVHEGQHYSSPIVWDAYRTLFPLQNIINTAGQKEYMKSLQADKKLAGWWGWWPRGPIMIGNHTISVFADAWAKGIRTFNPDSVLTYYYHEVTHSKLDADNGYNLEHVRGYGRMDYGDYFAKGYIPYPQNTDRVMESTSRTLEYTYDDFAAYQLAKMTGNTFYANIFKEHMYNYKNVFDPSDNFMKGKDGQGNWDKDFNPYAWGGPLVEGNAWQWKFFVPHDVQGLVTLMGGADQFSSELDEFFNVPADSVLPGGYGYRIHEISEAEAAGMGQYAPGNEPDFHSIYLYDYVGQPWKTQKLIRQSMARHFSSGPKGFPGDEDGGTMSAWYVFSALGFYPVTPATNQYAIGSPIFDKVTINLENGNKFTITAHNNSADNVYINSATLNDKAYPKNWITHTDIMNGGELHFNMSAQPNKQRGTSETDMPYSISTEN